MTKSLLSRSARSVKESLKSISAHTLASFFGKKSYPYFGLATGITSWKKEKKVLFESVKFQHKLPETIHPSIFWKFKEALEEEIPEEGFYKVPNAIATNRGEILLKNGKLLKTYLCPHEGLKPEKLDLFKLSLSRFSPNIFRSETPVSIITAGWQDAFFHWVYEVLPRIELIENTNDRLFVASDLSFQKESLQLFGINNVINANHYDAVEAPEITVTSTPVAPNPRAIQFLRKTILSQVAAKTKRRLYISRNDASRRRILNEDELMNLLAKHGFEKVLLSHLPFVEQVSIFRSAEAIVAPHGAALSLATFCDEGVPLLEIFAPAYVHPCYWRLANFASLPYYYLIGEGVRYPDYVDPHLDPDITVDVKKVEASLKLMGLV